VVKLLYLWDNKSFEINSEIVAIGLVFLFETTKIQGQRRTDGMNKIYKTVFNKKTGQLVAVQETASAHGQGGSTVTAAHPDNALAAAYSGLSLKPLLCAQRLGLFNSPFRHCLRDGCGGRHGVRR
jgi:hypothetical protein